MGTEGGLDCLQGIGLSAFELDIQAEQELVLPEYKGSTLRGAFGHAFKRVACPLKGQACSACLLGPKCAYFTIFWDIFLFPQVFQGFQGVYSTL